MLNPSLLGPLDSEQRIIPSTSRMADDQLLTAGYTCERNLLFLMLSTLVICRPSELF